MAATQAATLHLVQAEMAMEGPEILAILLLTLATQETTATPVETPTMAIQVETPTTVLVLERVILALLITTTTTTAMATRLEIRIMPMERITRLQLRRRVIMSHLLLG
ncbi:hypothetical protein BJ165DRAFT_1511095 [Panaeolus papilionaceus]|nr:hypothetical protein BJ165DRAFT_1511095 [Panaeolus papilionaceus]